MTPFPFSESCRLPSENKKRENFKNDLLKFPPVLPDDFCFICGKRRRKIKHHLVSRNYRELKSYIQIFLQLFLKKVFRMVNTTIYLP